MPDPVAYGAHVVCGHRAANWAANRLVTDQPHVPGLDSGCVRGDALTLAELKKRWVFQGCGAGLSVRVMERKRVVAC